LILIDNYDSFTYNIVQYLQEFGVQPKVFENDRVSVTELEEMDFERIIISPGAGNPDTAGVSLDVVKHFYRTKKILGVCLGHQCIAQFFGAKIVKAQEPVHGKTSRIFFDRACPLFKGIAQGFEATRYHSLVVEDIKPPLIAAAQTKNFINMAIQHKSLPVFGVQFHPEAILTEHGKALLNNFMNIA
jgi:anthranilate synthase/aminodeoxychorismate synthase-like glutamine amidotransferase